MEGGRSGVWWRVAVTAVAVVALVLPGRLLASQHAEDDALVPYGGDAAPVRAAPGQTVQVDAGVLSADPELVQLVEVRPRVAVDTALADIDIRLCTPFQASADPEPGAPSGTSCENLIGARARLRPGGARLVVSVTPTQAGRVRIDGYDVTYVEDGRRATEHAGEGFRLRVA